MSCLLRMHCPFRLSRQRLNPYYGVRIYIFLVHFTKSIEFPNNCIVLNWQISETRFLNEFFNFGHPINFSLAERKSRNYFVFTIVVGIVISSVVNSYILYPKPKPTDVQCLNKLDILGISHIFHIYHIWSLEEIFLILTQSHWCVSVWHWKWHIRDMNALLLLFWYFFVNEKRNGVISSYFTKKHNKTLMFLQQILSVEHTKHSLIVSMFYVFMCMYEIKKRANH